MAIMPSSLGSIARPASTAFAGSARPREILPARSTPRYSRSTPFRPPPSKRLPACLPEMVRTFMPPPCGRAGLARLRSHAAGAQQGRQRLQEISRLQF